MTKGNDTASPAAATLFRTVVQIPPMHTRIGYGDTLLSLGSCFADNIGRRLREHLFLVDVNPFGVLYNPLSVKQSLLTLLSDKRFTARDLFTHQSLWHSFAHSSLFSDTTPDRPKRGSQSVQ